MNVGSILNDETPPSDTEAKETRPSPTIANIQKSSQRNSIVNLLNDEKTEPTPEPVFPKAEPIVETPKQPEPQFPKKEEPKPATSNGPVKEEDEMTKLNKLKQNSKPKRYETPPIWAQEYIPGNKRNGNGNAVGPEVSPDPNESHVSSISDKSIFNTTSTSSVDLECSITGVIPPPSITRRIAEWIYANFVEVTEENRKHIELELKFGTIMDKRLNNRINILVSTECIYTDVSNIYFDSGIHEVGFADAMKYFDELERIYQEDLKNHPQKPRRKFNTLESDVTDSIYHVRNRNEQPKDIRISKDNALNPPRYTAINKQRMSDLYIHNPSSMYDLRLSLSLENPVPSEDIEHIMKKTKPSYTRMKKRNTFNHRPTVTTFDLTNVTTPRELKNTTTGKKVLENEKSFEVELEIDVLELFNGFDQFKNGTNSIRFEELVEIFINNGRCLNNRITKLAK